MTESARLADRLGIVALDETDYGDRSSEVTRVSTECLSDAVDLLETLGYDEVDVLAVEPARGSDDVNPMLQLQPTDEPYFVDNSAAVSIAPRTPDGECDE